MDSIETTSPGWSLSPGTYVGTSGFGYREWAAAFYAGVPREDWLGHYAKRFNALEIDTSFYHQVPRATYEGWAAQTPPDFRFTLKAHRYLTHMRRLDFEAESLERLRGPASGLGDKLAVVLWQLPDTLTADRTLLESFLDKLAAWPEVRHAIEFRHETWFTGSTAARLSRRGVAICQSDAPTWPLWTAVTTDLVLVRLHGHTALYQSAYDDERLLAWADRIRAWEAEARMIHLFFDNTAYGNAPKDAERLARLLAF